MDSAAVDLFAPEYADTEFRMDNVQRVAAQLGKLFGIPGPYVLKFVKPKIDTWTFEFDGKPVTIDVQTYAGIVTGKMKPHHLVENLLVDRKTAIQLCQIVTHLERTASVRAMAMQMEWARVRRAKALEARRQQLRAVDTENTTGTEDGASLEAEQSPGPDRGPGPASKKARRSRGGRADGGHPLLTLQG